MLILFDPIRKPVNSGAGITRLDHMKLLLSTVLTYKRGNLIQFNIIPILQLKNLRLKEVERLPNAASFSSVWSARGHARHGHIKADGGSGPSSARASAAPQVYVL